MFLFFLWFCWFFWGFFGFGSSFVVVMVLGLWTSGLHISDSVLILRLVTRVCSASFLYLVPVFVCSLCVPDSPMFPVWFVCQVYIRVSVHTYFLFYFDSPLFLVLCIFFRFLSLIRLITFCCARLLLPVPSRYPCVFIVCVVTNPLSCWVGFCFAGSVQNRTSQTSG